jgi:hypothetical protein
LRVLEQGLNFTIIEAPHPMDDPDRVSDYDARKMFTSARRVWLGAAPGVDWLHDELEAQFGEDRFWYDVQSRRNATHIGASGEIATVVLILMGAAATAFAAKFGGRLGERSADGLVDWVRDQTAMRRKETGLEWADPPPDFSMQWGEQPDELADRLRAEVADITALPADRIELMRREAREGRVLVARYRDRETGTEYETEVFQSEVVVTRVSPPTRSRR